MSGKDLKDQIRRTVDERRVEGSGGEAFVSGSSAIATYGATAVAETGGVAIKGPASTICARSDALVPGRTK
jgi:hypothetical protein